MGVDYRRDDVVVHDPRLPSDIFRRGDAFVLSLVGEHRAGDNVADRPYAGNFRAEVVIGFDLALFVECETNLVEAEAIGIGTPPDRDEHDVGLDRGRFPTFGRFDRQRRLAVGGASAGDLGAGLDVEALLFEDFSRFLAHFLVHAGQDLVEIFDHGDLGAKPQPNASEL